MTVPTWCLSPYRSDQKYAAKNSLVNRRDFINLSWIVNTLSDCNSPLSGLELNPIISFFSLVAQSQHNITTAFTQITNCWEIRVYHLELDIPRYFSKALRWYHRSHCYAVQIPYIFAILQRHMICCCTRSCIYIKIDWVLMTHNFF